MNSKSDDAVMLYNLAPSEMKAADIEAGKITITQQNGQATTFTLADGSTWSADRKTKTWTRIN